jgi:hypothetical protein
MDNRMLLWEGGLNIEGWKWLVTFRQNHVKMAWAFMNIMNVVHCNGILHNDLLKDNIMLHFSFDNLNVVHIGMCDRVKLDVSESWIHLWSLYGLAKEQDAINVKKTYWWVVLYLFIVHGELGITNPFWHITKQHKTNLRFEAYLVGKLGNVIWGENWMYNTYWTFQPRCHLPRWFMICMRWI